ncbi:MAG: palindromic element RPE4 domain-containing protein [Rickettsia endosymbiont of Eriopis connexa]|nr:palindromic element RPE4 domain-containing protein [Rickettsia endosymbiont of Eriopis connexa]
MLCHSHRELVLLHCSFFCCHPVIYSRDLVKNINNISIFSCFLDIVVKPRYDRGEIDSHSLRLRAMTTGIHTGNAVQATLPSLLRPP